MLVPLAFLSADLGAQAAAPPRPIGSPTATHPEEFTRIAGVRELSDGSVYVVDRNELRIVRLDFKTGEATAVGRKGQGPGEFTAPLGLRALPGDSAAVVDMMGGGNVLVLTKDGASPQPLRAVGHEPGGRPLLGTRDATDGRGRIYRFVMMTRTVDGKPMAMDTSAIVRLDRATGKEDTVAYVNNRSRSPLMKTEPERTVLAGGMIMSRPTSRPVPFRTVDQFAVAPDGRVAVVAVDPYRVTYFDAAGKRTDGPVIPYTPVRVNDAIKDAWRERAKRPSIGIQMDRNRNVSTRLMTPPYEEPEAWPDVLPTFLADAVSFAPDGNLWVERAVAPSSPPTFDVFDRAGRVSRSVALPMGRRLVGFGAASLYAVYTDEDDLEYLERYALPR